MLSSLFPTLTAEDPATLIPEVFKEMGKKGMKQQVIFYSNKFSDPVKLAQALYQCATHCPVVKLEVSIEEFR